MKFNIKARSIRMGATVAAVSLLAVSVGSVANAAAKKSSVVHISVVSLIPGSTQAAFNEFDNKVAQFEAANPGISVRAVQYQWLPATFAAKLASGTLPTVFTVPFTDGRSLGDNGQLANLTKYAQAEPYYKEFNPSVIAEGVDSKKQVIAIPEAAYAQALSYNRQLFSQAGLNPNKPPTTWAQLEADAKQISQRTGKAGYAEMGASDNTAGWILTTVTDALGGRMETGIGAKAKATFDTPQAVQALNMLKQMRWGDNSMGANFGLSWGTINQAFAAGQIGMFISGSDVYTNMVQADNINPSIYGLAPVPLAKSKTAGVMGGGTLAAVSPKSTPAQISAAMKWISFYYMDKLINRKAAIQDAKTLIKDKQPVGVPELPVFDQKLYEASQRWIKPYVNVPESQFAPFNNGIFSENVIPEPESATQAIYGDLDSVVQSVFTNQGADPGSLLSAANGTGQSSIASGAGS
ncbi:MAG TPA: extracellular solute-binding protein [Solirubrobacteraceae bacterium]|nr:extracellular solute-binding protein [Solirubrobacteraceae bacterium]